MGLGRWLTRGSESGSSDGTRGVRLVPWDDVEASVSAMGPVGREQAEGLPGVGRGVELIRAVIASLTPRTIKYLYSPDRPIEVVPSAQVLLEPDPGWHGRATWASAVVADLAWDGNAFADLTRETDRLGYPTRLPLIAPGRVTWEPSQTREDTKTYVVGPDPEMPGMGGQQRVEVDPSELWHAAVGVDSGRRMGRGILDRYQQALKLIVAVEQATWVVMRDGRPVGVLSVDADMTAAELTAAKQSFIRGVKSDGVAALVKAQFASVGWSATDLALIPAREHNLRLASDLTGVSAYLLGVPSESRVYANSENEWSDFVRVTVERYIEPIQDQLTRCVPRGQWVRYDTDDLARPDAETRWKNWKTAAEIGAMSIEEIRQEERLGPMTGPPPTADEGEDAA